MPTLAYRRLRGDMIECYKLTSGKYDSRVSQFLTLQEEVQEIPNRTRGHRKRLYVKTSKNPIRTNSFAYRVVDIWNKLPEEIVTADKMNTFKNRLDRLWEQEDIMFNFEKCMRKIKK